DYQLRVSSDGSLSDDYQVALQRGQEDVRYTIDLRDQLLFGPQEIERSFAVVDMQDRQALLLWTNEGASLQKSPGVPLAWHVKISPDASPVLAGAPGLVWPWTNSISGNADGFGRFRLTPWVADTI